MNHHTLDAGQLDALAAGGGGPRTVRLLLDTRHSRTLMLLRALLELAGSSPDRESVGQAYDALVTVEQAAPEPVRSVLSQPEVAHRIFTAARALATGGPPAASAFLANVAATAAHRAAVPLDIRVHPTGPPSDRRIVLPGLGSVRTDRSALFRTDGGDSRIQLPGRPVHLPPNHTESPGWQGFPELALGDGLALRIDRSGWITPPPGCSLAPPEPGWERPLREGWRLLRLHHPLVADETAAGFSSFLPLRTAPGTRHSTSFREAVGCLSMSRPPDAHWAALAVAHELQHTKLTALMDLFPLVEPGVRAASYAPWRTAARPLPALLQGAYAHLTVAGFWRRQRHFETTADDRRRAGIHYAQARTAAAEVVGTLHDQRLTPAGHRFVDRMAAELAAWEPARFVVERPAPGRSPAAPRPSGPGSSLPVPNSSPGPAPASTERAPVGENHDDHGFRPPRTTRTGHHPSAPAREPGQDAV